MSYNGVHLARVCRTILGLCSSYTLLLSNVNVLKMSCTLALLLCSFEGRSASLASVFVSRVGRPFLCVPLLLFGWVESYLFFRSGGIVEDDRARCSNCLSKGQVCRV